MRESVKRLKDYVNPRVYKYISRELITLGPNKSTPRIRIQSYREVASSTITSVHISTALEHT